MNSQDPRDEPDKAAPKTPPRRGGPSLGTKLRRDRLLKFFQGGWNIIRPRKATGTSLLSWRPGSHVTEAEIRAEIWSLGARHRGWPLEGALDELQTPGLPPQRVSLLRACVGRLQRP